MKINSPTTTHGQLSGVTATQHQTATHVEGKAAPGDAHSEAVSWTTAFAATPGVGISVFNGYHYLLVVTAVSTTACTMLDNGGGTAYTAKMCVAADIP